MIDADGIAMLGGNKHRTLRKLCVACSRCPSANISDKHDTDEVMIPLFVEDTDGTPMKRKVSFTLTPTWPKLIDSSSNPDVITLV